MRYVLKSLDFELSDRRVFRITFRDDTAPERLPDGASKDEPYYKEADIITESTEPPTIIEVFTERNRAETEDQLRNYQMLYRLATDMMPQGMLLIDTTRREVVTLETLRNIPRQAAPPQKLAFFSDAHSE